MHGAKILFTSGENLFRLEQANREHINPRGKHTRFSSVTYIFFHVFTSENMGDTSVLVYGETPIKP